MGRNKGCIKTAVSKTVKWSRLLIPCIPKSDDKVPLELTPQTVEKLYSVLQNDLRDLLLHMRRVIVYRTANYETGFFTEPTGVIDGKGLTAWFMINMEISELEEARYTSNLLNGHETLFTIVNHHMANARVGQFRRYPTPSNRYDGKTAASDFLFACYLCEKIGASWKDFVFDLSQWVFVYVPPEDDFEPQPEDPRAITPWIPSLWAGPLLRLLTKPHRANVKNHYVPNCNNPEWK